jgi:hypothetical protein
MNISEDKRQTIRLDKRREEKRREGKGREGKTIRWEHI